MKSIVPWLAALICAGWITSSAQAFRGLFQGLRNRNYADVPVTVQNTAPAPQPAAPVPQPADNCDKCDPTGGHHLLGGHLHSISGNSHSCFGRIKQCIFSDVPQKPPPPPKPHPINPYLRSPRDFYMLDDP